MIFPSSEPPVVGVDIGGSHISAALVDLENKEIISGSRLRLKVDCHAPAEEIIKTWTDVISTVKNSYEGKIKSVCIAMPGPFNYEEGICLIKDLDKYESLYGLNIKELLASNLGIESKDVLLRNDAEAFLHGEVFCGAARDYTKAIGVTLGTGLGSAVSVRGITADANRAVIPFKDGIAEDYISTRWFQKRYSELTGKTIKDVKSLLSLIDSKAVVDELFTEFGNNLGVFLNDFITDCRPEVVILGGNIAKALDGFLLHTLKKITKDVSVPIKQTLLWEDAAIIGAAASDLLVNQYTNNKT